MKTSIRSFRSEIPGLAFTICGLGLLIFLLRDDTFSLNTLALTLLFAGLATAWNLIGGLAGQFSMGHSVFFAIGGYVTADFYLKLGISPWLSLPVAAAAAGLLAGIVSWPVFRLRGPFFAIATMALTEVALAVAIYLERFTGGAQGLSIPFRLSFSNMIFRDRLSYTLLMFGFFIFCLVVFVFVLRSRLGYYLQAVRDNESAASASGIEVTWVKIVGMTISGALTGIGGALFIFYVRVADPPAMLSLFDIGVKIALIVLIGGIGTIYGPLYGALLVVPLEIWLRSEFGGQIPGANLIALGLILILASRFMKQGISSVLGAGFQRARMKFQS
jgi:branched-chain amino acid transport system permease protein